MTPADLPTTPAAAFIYRFREHGLRWGYDPDQNLFATSGDEPAISPEQEDVFFRYWLGVKILLQLESMTKPPASVTIEHDKRCQLACSYCYAGSNKATTSPRLDPKNLVKFMRKYQVRDLSIYGGDTFYDPAYAVGMVEDAAAAVGGLDRIYISTNALGLTPYWYQRLQTCAKQVEISVSAEPKFFGQRMTKAGPHQTDALRGRLADLPMDFRVRYTVVLSDAAPVGDTKFMDAVYELRDLAAGRAFGIKWAMVEDNVKVDRPLPWMERWVQENWVESSRLADRSLLYSFFGSSVMRNLKNWMLRADRGETHGIELYGALGGCGAGTSNFAFHFDGRVYTCHGKAVDGFTDHVVDGVPAWQRWQKSHSLMSPSFEQPLCRSCPVRQVCTLCNQRTYPLNCWFERERVAHGILMLHTHDRAGYDRLAKFTADGRQRILGKFDLLKEMVHSPAWDRMVRRKESLEDVQACYKFVFERELPPLLEVET